MQFGCQNHQLRWLATIILGVFHQQLAFPVWGRSSVPQICAARRVYYSVATRDLRCVAAATELGRLDQLLCALETQKAQHSTALNGPEGIKHTRILLDDIDLTCGGSKMAVYIGTCKCNTCSRWCWMTTMHASSQRFVAPASTRKMTPRHDNAL